MSKLVPSIYRHNHGLFFAVCAVIWAHTVLAFDELLPDSPERHTSPSFDVQDRLAPGAVFGALHIVFALLLLYALYKPRPDLFVMRMAFAGSATLFTLLTLGFLDSAITKWPHASLGAFATCGATTLACIAGVTTPERLFGNRGSALDKK